MPAYELTIDGVVKDFQHTSLRVALVANGRDAWGCDVASEGRVYVPVEGVPAVLTEDGNILVDGFLETNEEQGVGGEPILDALYRLTFASQDAFASRRIVNETFAAGTSFSTIVNTLVTNYLVVFGVSVGSLPSGPTLTEPLIIKNTVLTEVLDNLATWADGLLWSISDFKLSFQTPAISPSPFDITDSDNPRNTIGQIVKRTSVKNKKNTIIVTGGTPGFVEHFDQFTGNGTDDTFTLKYPIFGPIKVQSATLDNAIGNAVVDYGTYPTSTSTESLGEVNAPSGYFWEYSGDVTHQITRRGGPVANGVAFFVRYQRETPVVVTAIDAADVALNGPNEIRLDYPGIIVEAELQRIADAKLAEFGGNLDEVTYRTFNGGMRIGMVQGIECADRGINGNYLIVEATARNYEGMVEWTIRGIGGSRFKGSFRDLYTAWLRFGQGSSSAQSSVTIPPPGAGALGPGPPVQSFQYHKVGGIFGGADAFLYMETGGLGGGPELRLRDPNQPNDYTSFQIIPGSDGDLEITSRGASGTQQFISEGFTLIRSDAGDVGLQGVTGVGLSPGTFGAAVNRLQDLSVIEGLAGLFAVITSLPFTINTTTPSDTNEIVTFYINSSSSGTVNLPALSAFRSFPATSVRRIFIIKNIHATSVVTIDGNSSETIDGALTIALQPGASVILQGQSSTNWSILSASGSITGAGGVAGAGLLRTVTTLTDAQIKALPTTAVNVVAAPGANKIIVPWSTILITEFSGGAYTNINADSWWLLSLTNHNFPTNAFVANEAALSLTYVTDMLTTAKTLIVLGAYHETQNVSAWYFNGVVRDQSNLDNEALFIRADNQGSGDYTGGNGANTMKVISYYTIEDAT